MSASKRVDSRVITATATHVVLIPMAPTYASASLVTAGLISSIVWKWMNVVLENMLAINMQIVSTHLAATTANVKKAMRAMVITAIVCELSATNFPCVIRIASLKASS